MDEKNIVRHIDSEHTFQFYNRWSLELEQVSLHNFPIHEPIY